MRGAEIVLADNRVMRASSDAAIDALAGAAQEPSSPLSQVHLHHLGGAIARIESHATPYGHRTAAYLLNVIAGWSDAASSDAHVAWARGCAARALPTPPVPPT